MINSGDRVWVRCIASVDLNEPFISVSPLAPGGGTAGAHPADVVPNDLVASLAESLRWALGYAPDLETLHAYGRVADRIAGERAHAVLAAYEKATK
jgi:hypothetical protein